MNEPSSPLTERAPARAAAQDRGGKILLVGFISTVVIVETALFFFMVPSAEEVAALAEAKLIRNVQENEAEASELATDENRPQEIELGKYGETFSPIDTERKYTVNFRLFGLVRKKDLPRVEEELLEKSGRLRHAIRMKVRNSEIAELEENQLGLLQRRILATCNHLLEDDYLLSVGFTDYQVLED